MGITQDEMLPPEQMRRLFDILQAAGSKRVVWTEFPEGTHMEAYEVCRQEYWPALREFFEQYVLTGAFLDVVESYPGSHEATHEPVVSLPTAQNAGDAATTGRFDSCLLIADAAHGGKPAQEEAAPAIKRAAPHVKVAAPDRSDL